MAGTLAVSVAAHADPDPTTVAAATQKLNDLAMQSSQLTEKYDVAQADVAAKQTTAEAAQATALKAAQTLTAARVRLSEAVLAQYESPAFSATGALLTSQNGQQYLDTVSNLNLITVNRAGMVQVFDTASAASKVADARAADALAAANRTRDDLNNQRTTLAQSITRYQSVLATLTAAQQATYRNTNTVADTAAAVPAAQAIVRAATPAAAPAPAATVATAAASGAAATAVQFALAQVGKPYVFGAAGPSSYDCSGLTAAAYRAAGISLPHSAAGQYGYGTHVAYADLQPGDLIFLYRPIGHVEIYIGGGLAVSAPTSGENVKVIRVTNGNGYTGATRLV